MKYILTAFCLLVCCLCSCEMKPSNPGTDIMVNGNRIKAPAGSTVTVEGGDEVGAAISKHEGTAKGEGVGVVTDSEKVAQSIDASSPLARLFNGSGADGGATSIQQTLTGGSQATFLLGAAVLIGLGGIPVLIWVNRRAGFAMFGLAGVLIFAAMLPQWAWVAVAFAALIGAAVYIYVERSATRTKEALRAVTAGVEDLDDTTRRMAKAKIASHADDHDKAVIRSIKKADGLPPERP